MLIESLATRSSSDSVASWVVSAKGSAFHEAAFPDPRIFFRTADTKNDSTRATTRRSIKSKAMTRQPSEGRLLSDWRYPVPKRSPNGGIDANSLLRAFRTMASQVTSGSRDRPITLRHVTNDEF